MFNVNPSAEAHRLVNGRRRALQAAAASGSGHATRVSRRSTEEAAAQEILDVEDAVAAQHVLAEQIAQEAVDQVDKTVE